MGQTITGKLMEDKLKHGWSSSDFAKHLGCSEEKFIEDINRKFSSKAAHSMIIRLEKNAENREKVLKNRAAKQKKSMKIIEKVTGSSASEDIEVLDEKELLEAKKEEISNYILEYENSHKDYVQKKKSIIDELLKEKEELKRLEKEVRNHKDKVQGLVDKLGNIEASINKTASAIKEKTAELDEVKKQLRAINKITIYVYDNGSIEAEDTDFDSIHSNGKYYELIGKFSKQVENLTIKQIKQLAKLLSFLKNIDRDFELVFDSEELQNVYNSLQS